MKTKYFNVGVVVCLVVVSLVAVSPVRADPTTWPVDSFWNYPYDPSIFDKISFGLYGETPPEWTCLLDFGDGTTYNQCFVDNFKQYTSDGDYTVSVQVNNGSYVSSASRVLSVRTHDVGITKFSVPKSAMAGQTRQIVVNVRNNRYPETVQVELYKVLPDGLLGWVGTLIQSVPVRSGNRTTAFSFNYTFTAEDAYNGKVTFKAMAFILVDIRDALPGDNEASLTVKVGI